MSMKRCLWVILVGLAVTATSCSSDDSGETSQDPPASTTSTTAPIPEETTTTSGAPPPPPVAIAEVAGPIVSDNGPVLPQPVTPLPDGYVEEEFFIGGQATRYETVGEAGADGLWTAQPADTADYRTRVLVRRPPADVFSGTVVVEWLNVTAVEASPDWGYLSEEIGRSGHAYMAVSAQALGVIGGEALLSVEIDAEASAEFGTEGQEPSSGGLVNIDPDRYGTLAHPGDAYAFDMFSQVGAAVAAESDLILGGLDPATVLALGESQSAGFLTTYLNAIHPLARVYDGFLVHSRGAGGAPIGGAFGEATEEGSSSFTDEGVRIRTDLTEPVFIVQAETDLTLLGYSLARQPDTDTVRTWEMAGTAHADAHIIRGIIGGPRNPAVGSLLGCDALINAGPHHEGVQAALHHLVIWIEGGPPPPAGARIQLTDSDPVAIARDELGVALGGVRNPLVDVPVAVYSGDPPGGLSLDSVEGFDICGLFGQTTPIAQTTLIELHGSADDYVAAFTAATENAVDAGFLLPGDAAQLIEEAEANRALFGPVEG